MENTKKAPNILFIITDQQRRNSLGAYGCKYVSTPNLDTLANEATIYDRAYCNAPVCTPSRASILTGKTLSGHGVYNLFDILPENEELLPEYLRRLGYSTALVGKLHVSGIMYEAKKRNPGDGFDIYELSHEPSILFDAKYNAYAKWLLKNFPKEYETIKENGRKYKNRPTDSHFSTWVSERGAEIIRNRDKSKPLFLNLGYFDPHSPYDCHPLESEKMLNEEFREPIVMLENEKDKSPDMLNEVRRIQCKNPSERFTAEEAEQLRRGYFAGVSFIDLQLGKVIKALKDEGIYDNTMIVFTSDHGDMICDHDLLGKGAFFYDDGVNVPLIIKYPGQVEGQRDDRLVQLNDLFATMLTVAGGDSYPADSLPLNGEAERSTAVCEYFGCGQLDLGKFPHPIMATMIRNERYKLNLYHDTEEMQLFDMSLDPEEMNDISKEPEMQGVICSLMQAYLQRKSQTEHRQNAARGGLSEIPSFSRLKR